jgi:hypothetical protein
MNDRIQGVLPKLFWNDEFEIPATCTFLKFNPKGLAGIAFTVTNSIGNVVFDSRRDFPSDLSAVQERTVYLSRD